VAVKEKSPLDVSKELLWWCQLDSNQRHKDFQSFALPTELWHLKFLFLICYSQIFGGGASWIRTSDTRIFSPLLYQLSYGTFLLFCYLDSVANVVSFFQI